LHRVSAADPAPDKELIRATHPPIVGKISSEICEQIVQPHRREPNDTGI
jgi:hypothetical protein